MARTTQAAVQGILISGKQWDGKSDLEAFIDTANVLVDQVVEGATAKGLTLSDRLLEKIEAWLAAHFYVVTDQMFSSKSQGGASASFQGQTGMGLDYSPYGQQAKRLDISGTLNALDKGAARATCGWLGKAPSEQIDYEDRD